MSIKLIYASSLNNVIGHQGKIPWHIPADLKRFKELTMGETVVMGRKTFESLPDSVKPLPGRLNIVLTRDTKWLPLNSKGEYLTEDITVMGSVPAALEFFSKKTPIFVIGGETVYKKALPYADTIYHTLVKDNFEGDAFGPDWNHGEWDLSDFSNHKHEGLKYQFRTFKRR